MGIIGDVKNFFSNAGNVIKNIAKAPSLLASIAKNTAEEENEQETNMFNIPDVQSGSFSNTGSSWANEFLNAPTFDINSLSGEDNNIVIPDDSSQHDVAPEQDDLNLNSTDIINSSYSNPVTIGSNPAGAGNVIDEMPNLYKDYYKKYGAVPAGTTEPEGFFKFMSDAGDWVEDVTYEDAVGSNLRKDMAIQQEYVVKGGNPGYFSSTWGGKSTEMPYIDVLEGRDDVIARIIDNITDEYPEEPTYEDWVEIMNRAYEEVSGGDYFTIKRLRRENLGNPNLLLEAATKGEVDEGLTPEKYSQEEWEKISNLNKDYNVGEKYTPTKKEFRAYLDNFDKNNETYNNLIDIYREAVDNDIFTSNEELEQLRERFMDIAMEGIHSKIQTNVGSIDGGEAAEAEVNYNNAINDQLNRTLVFANGIFELEKEALEKPEEKRNEGDWYIIDTANRARRALDKYAYNLNDYMSRILDEGVNSKGQIEDALDRFEDGSSLHDVLTDGLANIMGLEGADWRMEHVSPIDMFQKLANDGRYRYTMANGNGHTKGWDWLEFQGSKVGDSFSEALQAATFGTIFRGVNIFKGNGKWLRPQSMDYFDNDFSIGKLIETDDGWHKRTVKKYALQFFEYAPEVIANTVPDILSIAYFGPGGGARTLSNIGRIGKFAKGTKKAAYVKSLRDKITAVDKTLSGLEKVGAIGRKRANINSKNARIWNIIDRTLTQFAIGQGMDAKLSIFDSESYSDTSFWISMLGSFLGDILPEAKDFRGVWRTGAKGGKGGLRTAGVWDLVDFISQSEENAWAVANRMGKLFPTFTEQELRDFVETFANTSQIAEDVYKTLSKQGKAAANSWTKDLMYNYIKQAYGENSSIGIAIRTMMKNKNVTAADIIKFVGNIPGTVKIGPYSSIIKLKHGTLAEVTAKNGPLYDVTLDILDGGFDKRLTDGFTESDLRQLSSLDGYKDTYKEKDKLFKKVGDKYYLTDEGLDWFGLKESSITAESLGVSLEQAENTRRILKEKMRNLINNKLDGKTIDALADFGGYDEVVEKVKEILC